MEGPCASLTSVLQAASCAPPVHVPDSNGCHGSQGYARAEFAFNSALDSPGARPEPRST